MNLSNLTAEFKEFMFANRLFPRDIVAITKEYKTSDFSIKDICIEFGLTMEAFEYIRTSLFPKARRKAEIEAELEAWKREFLTQNWQFKDAKKCRKRILQEQQEEIQTQQEEEAMLKNLLKNWYWEFKPTNRHTKAICNSGRRFG